LPRAVIFPAQAGDHLVRRSATSARNLSALSSWAISFPFVPIDRNALAGAELAAL
jgi:hypothetical protein